MSGPKKGGVFAGRGAGRNAASGVFTIVTGPGLGKAATMDRRVFDKAVKSANTALRNSTHGTVEVRNPDGRRR